MIFKKAPRGITTLGLGQAAPPPAQIPTDSQSPRNLEGPFSQPQGLPAPASASPPSAAVSVPVPKVAPEEPARSPAAPSKPIAPAAAPVESIRPEPSPQDMKIPEISPQPVRSTSSEPSPPPPALNLPMESPAAPLASKLANGTRISCPFCLEEAVLDNGCCSQCGSKVDEGFVPDSLPIRDEDEGLLGVASVVLEPVDLLEPMEREGSPEDVGSASLEPGTMGLPHAVQSLLGDEAPSLSNWEEFVPSPDDMPTERDRVQEVKPQPTPEAQSIPQPVSAIPPLAVPDLAPGEESGAGNGEESPSEGPTRILPHPPVPGILQETTILIPATLVLLDADGRPGATSCTLNIGNTCLGRGEQNDICLEEEFASRSHCTIRYRKYQYVLEDLGSANGTFVNDVRVQQTILRDGDTIQIGATRFVFGDPMEKSRKDRVSGH